MSKPVIKTKVGMAVQDLLKIVKGDVSKVTIGRVRAAARKQEIPIEQVLERLKGRGISVKD